MNILAINGSPHGARGNTERLLQPFLEGTRQAAVIVVPPGSVWVRVRIRWRNPPDALIWIEGLQQVGHCIYNHFVPPRNIAFLQDLQSVTSS